MRLCVQAESSLPPPKLRSRRGLKTVQYQQVGQHLSSLDFQVAHADQLAFVAAVAIRRVKAAKLCWCMLLNHRSSVGSLTPFALWVTASIERRRIEYNKPSV